jgi:hypothetical protein
MTTLGLFFFYARYLFRRPVEGRNPKVGVNRENPVRDTIQNNLCLIF